MSNHTDLSFEHLLNWVEGRLSAAESERVAQVIAIADPVLQQQVDWLRAFTKIHSQVLLPAPPLALRAALNQRFVEFTAAQRPPNLFRQFMAALTFDSAQQPTLVGVRAGETDSSQQMIFASQEADIVLNSQTRKQDQRINLFGQILPNRDDLSPSSFSIQLLQSEREIDLIAVDELGEFAFEALLPGEYLLIVSGADFEIALPSFNIGR